MMSRVKPESKQAELTRVGQVGLTRMIPIRVDQFGLIGPTIRLLNWIGPIRSIHIGRLARKGSV